MFFMFHVGIRQEVMDSDEKKGGTLSLDTGDPSRLDKIPQAA